MFPADMSHVDSGNYTCDVSGPGAQLLGVVKYTIHVKGKHKLEKSQSYCDTNKLSTALCN